MTDRAGAGWLIDAGVVARFELIRRLRSRALFINAVVAPTALALVFGALIGGNSGSGASFDVVVAAEEPGGASGVVAEELTGIDSGGLVTRSVDGRGGAVAAVTDDEADAAIFVAADGSMEVIADASRPLSGQVAKSVADRGASIASRGGASPPPLTDIELGGRATSTMAYFGASMAGLLLLFSAGLAARSVLEDRAESRWPRMIAGGTSPGAIVVGKVAAVGVASTIGFMVVWVITTVVGGAVWGEPIAVIAMIVATVAAMSGIALFLGGVARTPTQLDTATAVTAFVLAMLGGSFVPPADAPATLKTLRSISPNGISLEGFVELNSDAAGLSGIADEALLLFAIGLLLGLVGEWRSVRNAQVGR